MEFLPRSIAGAVIAIAYLLFAGYFVVVAFTAGGGPHGDAGTALLYLIFLTFPLSVAVMGGLLPLIPKGAELLGGTIIIVGLIYCALFNAAIIYLVIGFAGKLIKSVIGSFRGKGDDR